VTVNFKKIFDQSFLMGGEIKYITPIKKIKIWRSRD